MNKIHAQEDYSFLDYCSFSSIFYEFICNSKKVFYLLTIKEKKTIGGKFQKK